MRWIQKNSEPVELIEWRSRNKTRDESGINFGYELMRKDHQVTKAVTNSLLQEQGWLCAYTGIRINGYTNPDNPLECDCHIDHVKAQDYCCPEEKVTYSNMVACYPGPNQKAGTPFGGERKKNWPDHNKGEQHLFLSPLASTCESRFLFDLKGEIKHRDGDLGAKETIKNLGLNHDILKAMRKGAIQGTIGKNNDLSIKQARSRLKSIKSQQSGTRLEPFCFVLVQALEKHIKRLEAIAKAKQAKKKQ